MPATLGEDAGAAALPGRGPLLEDTGRGGPATSVRLGPRDEGADAPVVPEARG
jgi:hypothetical protein